MCEYKEMTCLSTVFYRGFVVPFVGVLFIAGCSAPIQIEECPTISKNFDAPILFRFNRQMRAGNQFPVFCSVNYYLVSDTKPQRLPIGYDGHSIFLLTGDDDNRRDRVEILGVIVPSYQQQDDFSPSKSPRAIHEMLAFYDGFLHRENNRYVSDILKKVETFYGFSSNTFKSVDVVIGPRLKGDLVSKRLVKEP